MLGKGDMEEEEEEEVTEDLPGRLQHGVYV